MPNFICTTCGTQSAESDQPPAACAVCQDERQYVKATGQQWTTLHKLMPTELFVDVDIQGPLAYRQYGDVVAMATDPDKVPTAHFDGPLTVL